MNVTMAPSVPATPDAAAPPGDAGVAGDVFASLLAAIAPLAAPAATQPGMADCAFGTEAAEPSEVTWFETTCAFGAPGTVPTTFPAVAEGALVAPDSAFDTTAFDTAAVDVTAPLVVTPEVPARAVETTDPLAASAAPAAAVTNGVDLGPDVTTEAPTDGDEPDATEVELPTLDATAPLTPPTPVGPQTDTAGPATDAGAQAAPIAAAPKDPTVAPASDRQPDTGVTPPPVTNEPAGDTTPIVLDAATRRTATASADVAPTSIGRLVAATLPHLRDTNEVRLSVRLDPPTLGHVTVDISTRDGAVHVVVRPTEAASSDVLAAQRSAVDAALTQAGFELGGFDVRSNDRRDAPKPRSSSIDLDEVDEIQPSTSDDGALRL